MSVATREGGVDRNPVFFYNKPAIFSSPPARVAWIETYPKRNFLPESDVATREGDVDRNSLFELLKLQLFTSPPARVAWIETC